MKYNTMVSTALANQVDKRTSLKQLSILGLSTIKVAAPVTALISSQSSFAQPISTKFPPQITVASRNLLLNGAGTRYKAFFKVYDMAMYLSRKAKTAEEALALAGPARLNFVALRELPGTDLGRLFLRGMQDNNPQALVTRYAASSSRLIEIFSGKAKLNAGETFAMEFVPSKGTQFYINEQTQGAAIGDDEYFRMILRIWLGNIPADYKLKEDLLG